MKLMDNQLKKYLHDRDELALGRQKKGTKAVAYTPGVYTPAAEVAVAGKMQVAKRQRIGMIKPSQIFEDIKKLCFRTTISLSVH